MIALFALATAIVTPSAMIDLANERIATAAMIRCPKPSSDEIVVCSRASARDRYFLPLPRELPPGDRRIENALGERAALAGIGKYSTPGPVGPGGQSGWTLHEISLAVGEGTFTPLHKRFEGPDVQFVPVNGR